MSHHQPGFPRSGPRDEFRQRAADAGYADDAHPSASPGQLTTQLCCGRACFQQFAISPQSPRSGSRLAGPLEYLHAQSVRCVCEGGSVCEERETVNTPNTATNAVAWRKIRGVGGQHRGFCLGAARRLGVAPPSHGKRAKRPPFPAQWNFFAACVFSATWPLSPG